MRYDKTIEQLQEQRAFIDAAISALTKIAAYETRQSSAAPQRAKTRGGSKKGRKFSAEARARMSAAAEQRWARQRAEQANGNGNHAEDVPAVAM